MNRRGRFSAGSAADTHGLLTARPLYGKARRLLGAGPLIPAQVVSIDTKVFRPHKGPARGIVMVKPEWGAKHGCPKCGTRFYDRGKDDPVTCIDCGYAWHPEPVLKSKSPIPYEEVQKEKVAEVADGDLAEEDLDIDDDGDSPDNDVDLGGDDDLGVGVGDSEGDEH
jgi:uncharacterized protein (TIGR02300 family)